MNGGTEMDVREKLVELLSKYFDIGDSYAYNLTRVKSAFACGTMGFDDFEEFDEETVEDIASYLIKNGVTVQEWISVDDMLPEIPEGWAETPEPVLYMMKNTKTIYAGYYGEGGVWKDKYLRQYADSRNGVDADDVLCWIYQHDLPQPLKGE